jgi:hypothetical protein
MLAVQEVGNREVIPVLLRDQVRTLNAVEVEFRRRQQAALEVVDDDLAVECGSGRERRWRDRADGGERLAVARDAFGTRLRVGFASKVARSAAFAPLSSPSAVANPGEERMRSSKMSSNSSLSRASPLLAAAANAGTSANGSSATVAPVARNERRSMCESPAAKCEAGRLAPQAGLANPLVEGSCGFVGAL